MQNSYGTVRAVCRAIHVTADTCTQEKPKYFPSWDCRYMWFIESFSSSNMERDNTSAIVY